MYAATERWVTRLAWIVAIAGGGVLTALTVTTVVAILGRFVATLPPTPEFLSALDFVRRAIVAIAAWFVRGNYEFVEVGVGFAVFAFMPWCQLNRGHASVEILTNLFPDAVNAAIDLIAYLLLAAMAVYVTWRMWLGMFDKLGYHETTFILQFPVWWGYAAAMTGAVAWVIVALFCVWRSVREMRAGVVVQPSGGVH